MQQDTAEKREYMVWSQIEPAGVQDNSVLSAFESIPRENFVSDSDRASAYRDEDIKLPHNRILMEPSVHARLLQAMKITLKDVALVVGSANGYASLVLAQLASTVIQLEASSFMITEAQEHIDMFEGVNIVTVEADITGGCPEHAPYDVIFINGAVANRPDAILRQLNIGGRCACVIKESDRTSGQAILFEKTGQDDYSETALFDASCPYLGGFEPSKEFKL